MSSLNPNHEVVRRLDQQWHKLCALAMVSMSTNHIVLTAEDIDYFTATGLFITVQELPDGLHLKLVDEATAHRLAREHGGLPI
jgi:hypothetical protein